eukprot:TRINITY_DN5170_c0_g2_i3.p1 TRINITY_DN5170_c0_g2~~TRINITY_DN5170_c0_g2_i3.p1  ORF type:complete len:455 (-),score=62.02 TRINITY_DN5170_c0_g2_i3:62-1327(-)
MCIRDRIFSESNVTIPMNALSPEETFTSFINAMNELKSNTLDYSVNEKIADMIVGVSAVMQIIDSLNGTINNALDQYRSTMEYVVDYVNVTYLKSNRGGSVNTVLLSIVSKLLQKPVHFDVRLLAKALDLLNQIMINTKPLPQTQEALVANTISSLVILGSRNDSFVYINESTMRSEIYSRIETSIDIIASARLNSAYRGDLALRTSNQGLSTTFVRSTADGLKNLSLEVINSTNSTMLVKIKLPSDLNLPTKGEDGSEIIYNVKAVSKLYNPFDNTTTLKSPVIELAIQKASRISPDGLNRDFKDPAKTEIKSWGELFILEIPLRKAMNETEMESKGNKVCRFWDVEEKMWSSKGCYLLNYTNSSVTCGCNHLTNFAVDFMDNAEYIFMNSNLKNLADFEGLSNLNFKNSVALYLSLIHI